MAASTKTQSAAGTKLYIATAAPATQDEAGFKALVWVVVGKVKSYTPGTNEAEVISLQYLEDLFESKNKGVIKIGNSNINVDVVDGDAGQSACRAALTSTSPVSLKVAYPNGRQRYVSAYVAGYSEGELQPNNMVSATIVLAQTVINTATGAVPYIESIPA